MPTTARDQHFDGPDGLRLYYQEYPGPGGDGAPVVCLPGLTRNHRDFEGLAARLSARRRVLAPDLRGRGRSDYDPDPKRYHPGTYVADVLALLEAAQAPRVIVIGTSLGGLLAMLLTATRPDAIAGVVLNDIGPEIDPKGLARIQGYVGSGGPFASWEEAADAARSLNGPILPDLDADGWLRFAQQTYVEEEAGRIRPDYDPRIAEAFSTPGGATPQADMWQVWNALREIPALAIRGGTSDILSPETFDKMAREKPDLRRTVVPRVGHAPQLTEPECLAAIASFLDEV